MRGTVLLWTLSILLQGSKLLAFSLTGSGSCQYGDAQCNVCLKNVKQSFSNVAKEGSYLGFAMGDSNDVSNCKAFTSSTLPRSIYRMYENVSF